MSLRRLRAKPQLAVAQALPASAPKVSDSPSAVKLDDGEGGTIYRKGGLTVESTNSHESDFTNDKITFRVKERLALQVKYPKAFVKVTLGKAA